MISNSKIHLSIIRDYSDQGQVENFHGNSLVDLLKGAFGCMPSGVEIFHEEIHPSNLVTPKNEEDVRALLCMRGRFYAILVPQGLDPISWLIIGVSILVAVGVALMMPDTAIPENGSSSQPPSPNNSLSGRSNRQRLGGRVPDMVGTNWSLPDLIAPTYKVYIDNEEVEFSYMALGRGKYDIKKALDDTTDIKYISGATIRVYEPNMSYISDAPVAQWGNNLSILEEEYANFYARQYSAMNGQVLPPPDDYVIGDDNISANALGELVMTGGKYDLTNHFAAGDDILVNGATDLGSSLGLTTPDLVTGLLIPVMYNFDGIFVVDSVTSDTVKLSSPGQTSPDWDALISANDSTIPASITISTESQALWSNWFYTDSSGDYDDVMINIKAPRGIYTSNGNEHSPSYVKIIWESEEVDDADVPVAGTLEENSVNIEGRGGDKYRANGQYTWTTDDDVRRTAARTAFVSNSHFSQGKKLRVRFRRESRKLDLESNQNVDEVRLESMYGMRIITTEANNEDITTVHSKQKATDSALSMKQRKLRLLCQRHLNAPNGTVIKSDQADDILYHLATDSKIGNLTDSQIDFDQIKAETQEIRDYFGNDKCTQFCYTFDQNGISSEETLQSVAQAAFSQMYRFNAQLQMYFERPQDVGVAVFNSNNILPDTFTYSESFGINKDYDGVLVKYRDPVDDAQVIKKTSYSCTSPDERTLVGVRNSTQAAVHMHRAWAKHRFSNKSIEFNGADESNIVIRNQRIEVANQSHAIVMQGSVERLYTVGTAVIATLSEPFDEIDGLHTIFIQMMDGAVDNIICQDASSSSLIDPTTGQQAEFRQGYEVVLSRMPSSPISTSNDNVVMATYHIVPNRNVGKSSYIVTSRDPSDGLSNTLTAVNYDHRFYENDIA